MPVILLDIPENNWYFILAIYSFFPINYSQISNGQVFYLIRINRVVSCY